MRTLKEVRIGETVKVSRINGEGAIKRRIMDMGRKADAAMIDVE